MKLLYVFIAIMAFSAETMGKKLYVGNLSWNTTDETLRQVFSEYGEITSAIVMRDRDTGRSRGFGFVEFSIEAEAQLAIDALNETELDGRRIRVQAKNNRKNIGDSFGSSYGNGNNVAYNSGN